MKKGIVTSFLATALIGALAFFFNAPKKINKSKTKTVKNRFSEPKSESSDLFI